MDKILNLTLPEPLNRGADQILRFCVPPKRGSEKHSNRYTLPPVVKITMPSHQSWWAATHILTHIFFLANNSILYSKIPESRNKESNWRYAYKHSNFFHLSVYLSVYFRFSKLITIQFNHLKFVFGFLSHRQDYFLWYLIES